MKTKFISLGVACLSFLALTSCMRKANADYSTVRQITKIDTEVSTALNLFYDATQDDFNAQLLDTDTKNNTYLDNCSCIIKRIHYDFWCIIPLW